MKSDAKYLITLALAIVILLWIVIAFKNPVGNDYQNIQSPPHDGEAISGKNPN
jgi:hypothetical protein